MKVFTYECADPDCPPKRRFVGTWVGVKGEVSLSFFRPTRHEASAAAEDDYQTHFGAGRADAAKRAAATRKAKKDAGAATPPAGEWDDGEAI